MQLEKEQAIFNKERYRAERKIAKTEQDIEEAPRGSVHVRFHLFFFLSLFGQARVNREYG